MNIYLIPTMGSLHLRYPSYNALSVSDLLSQYNPESIAITSLSKNEYDKPQWQDSPEIVLPLAVMPWAKKRGLDVHFVKEPSPDAKAYQDFRRYAQNHPDLQNKLYQSEIVLRPLEELLSQALSIGRILKELVPIIYESQKLEEELLEEGPATNWRRSRSKTMAKRILAIARQSVAVLVAIDDYPFLKEELEKEANIIETKKIAASPAAKQRSLLDFAFRTEVANPEELLESLEAIASPEAYYHMGNILLHNGHFDAALEKLVAASKTDFSQPYFLAGYLLARLGQVYDLQGNRNMAQKSYRGGLEFDYAPKDAITAAQEGLAQAFKAQASI